MRLQDLLVRRRSTLWLYASPLPEIRSNMLLLEGVLFVGLLISTLLAIVWLLAAGISYLDRK